MTTALGRCVCVLAVSGFLRRESESERVRELVCVCLFVVDDVPQEKCLMPKMPH